MLEKLNEYGDVKFLEEKAPGNMLVTYGGEWQADRAYSILFFSNSNCEIYVKLFSLI